jgi:hypothetical protein
VLNDVGGREQLRALGASTVPVLAKGGEYIFCQNFEDVAEFVGVQGSVHTPLPPAELYRKWLIVLGAAQRYLRQMPEARLAERVIDNRDRSIRLMGHHIFRIAAAFLETAIDDVEYWTQNANLPPADGTCTRSVEIIAYGDGVITRLEKWWNDLDDRSCQRRIKTFYGTPPMHQLFERSTWHSAQHTRQLIAVLERFGIEPDVRLTSEDLAGLPLPEGLWE